VPLSPPVRGRVATEQKTALSVLATRFGLAAIDAVHDGAWGTMVALRSTNIELVALSDAVAQLRTVPVEEYQRYGVLFA
jgi:ATP-dependent phosphofructokinase / diphosphate-dependent phosphofructokinase